MGSGEVGEYKEGGVVSRASWASLSTFSDSEKERGHAGHLGKAVGAQEMRFSKGRSEMGE